MESKMNNNQTLSFLNDVLTSTMNPNEDVEEACANSHIISVNSIEQFCMDMDRIFLVCTLFSAVLQVYVMFAALKHIKKKTSDKCMHV
uniref:Transmembrane protein n=1 Tax=Panagrolaimus sp. JU765 TaxID=591449 RepID=A0AC34RDH5_9BILA